MKTLQSSYATGSYAAAAANEVVLLPAEVKADVGVAGDRP
jgi:hypothetical protein